MLTLHAFYVAACAVVFAVVLVDTGMLLEPLQRAVREWHMRWYNTRWQSADEDGTPRQALNTEHFYWQGNDLDSRWWWKPLWGCVKCVAGQWALWGYLVRCCVLHDAYSPWQHAAFVSLTILFACILTKAYQWSQQ
ncbi:hypothetical protein F0P96_10585 [Hymenobacter busanensis]|uniref:Uncharacterized protein n=1 Tax=Hymenobacter busanensis TaxID=2607656 RepID=A0A7L4ZYA1_9BACT|nr:hypothetical protein [Hymenobacter busanensis]KAA9333407.1 hypothetical protein F0P96_10585 [Hymenobacter busanensis]QHJ07913.1 hypothetical protein GUY19_11720 [Hymenobacter busanensis]